MAPIFAPMIHFDPSKLIIEFIFVALVMILCLLIYFKTKEFYQLTKRKTIFFFRNTFIFFSLAFLLRFIFIGTRLLDLTIFHFRGPNPIMLMVISYLSTMALISLLYSLIWKKITHKYIYLITNIIVLIISIIVFIFRSIELLFFAQLLIFISVLIILFKKSRKKKSSLHLIYALLLLSWILNLYVSVTPRFLLNKIMIPTYLISITIYGIIYFKVYKWAK